MRKKGLPCSTLINKGFNRFPLKHSMIMTYWEDIKMNNNQEFDKTVNQ